MYRQKSWVYRQTRRNWKVGGQLPPPCPPTGYATDYECDYEIRHFWRQLLLIHFPQNSSSNRRWLRLVPRPRTHSRTQTHSRTLHVPHTDLYKRLDRASICLKLKPELGNGRHVGWSHFRYILLLHNYSFRILSKMDLLCSSILWLYAKTTNSQQ